MVDSSDKYKFSLFFNAGRKKYNLNNYFFTYIYKQLIF